MIIKKAKNINDYFLINQLANSIWRECYKEILSIDQIDYMLSKFFSLENIKEEINKGMKYYLIDDIGFLAHKEIDNRLFLSKLYLNKESRRKGMAKEIINMLSKGNKSIYLTVNKYNKTAITAYKKLGFKIIDSVITPIGEGFVMDDYIMEKELL